MNVRYFTIVVVTFNLPSFVSSCIGGASTPQTLAARNRALAAPNFELDLQSAKCTAGEYDVYKAKDLRRLATLYEMIHPAIPVIDGGTPSCEFDSETEHCAWYDQQVGLSGFRRAQFESFFDIEKFDCTSERQFTFRNFFLLAGGEETERDLSAAIEIRIPCQLEKAYLKFDYWANNDVPVLKVCVILEDSGTPQCEESHLDVNPLTFEIPQSLKPFRLRIQVEAIGRNEIVFLDGVHYDARFCEIMPSTNSTLLSASTVTESAVSPYELANSINEIPKKKKVFGITNFVNSEDKPFKQDSNGRLNVCEALSCDFNHGDSCFYSLAGVGGTAEWRIGERFLGNPHTGVHKPNPIDQKMTGYAFVGSDQNDYENEVFVLESSRFSLNEPVYLVFDLYQRSKGPQLKVCVDSFDDCPYTSPPLSPREFWRPDQRLLLDEGVEKIFFVAGKVSRNLYLGIDNVRVQTTSFDDYCSQVL